MVRTTFFCFCCAIRRKNAIFRESAKSILRLFYADAMILSQGEFYRHQDSYAGFPATEKVSPKFPVYHKLILYKQEIQPKPLFSCGKEKTMGLDSNQKVLANYNDVFADIMNVLLYNGKHIIREQNLEDSKDRSQYKAEGLLHEQERDVSKIYKHQQMRIAFWESKTKTGKRSLCRFG